MLKQPETLRDLYDELHYVDLDGAHQVREQAVPPTLFKDYKLVDDGSPEAPDVVEMQGRESLEGEVIGEFICELQYIIDGILALTPNIEINSLVISIILDRVFEQFGWAIELPIDRNASCGFVFDERTVSVHAVPLDPKNPHWMEFQVFPVQKTVKHVRKFESLMKILLQNLEKFFQPKWTMECLMNGNSWG
jgi:hypothetical protein